MGNTSPAAKGRCPGPTTGAARRLKSKLWRVDPVPGGVEMPEEAPPTRAAAHAPAGPAPSNSSL